MRRKERLPELLAPAGNYECLCAALTGGANAVYIGGKRFSARAYAGNFEMSEIRRAAEYAHTRGASLYVTLNTLLSDGEIPDAVDYARELYSSGVDALIVADLGAAEKIHTRVPGLSLHASTQMSVNNTAGAELAARLGMQRVVLARELSIDNIRAAVEKCPVEIEVFLHGALCVSHSGQCLFSSLVGGRSGNRGECAQPCRLPYGTGNGKNPYPLSLRDLSLAGHIPALISSGVASLKIEGRMKSADYVYGVTKIYRALIDENRAATQEECEILRRLFSRGGFTDGYFTGKIAVGMCGIRTETDKAESRTAPAGKYGEIPTPAAAEIKIEAGAPASLTLSAAGKSVCVAGEIPEPAKSRPLDCEAVIKQITKTGGTLFTLPPENIAVALGDGLNLSPAALNSLRRDAVESLSRAFGEEVYMPYSPKPRHFAFTEPRKIPRRTALFISPERYSEAVESGADIRYFDVCFLPLPFTAESAGANGVYLPPVITDGEWDNVMRLVKEAKLRGAEYALCGNLSHFEIAESTGLIPVGDFRLNIYNAEALRAFAGLGLRFAVLSAELTLPAARDLVRTAGSEILPSVIVYGRIPLMLTERCFTKEGFGCGGCSRSALTDRRGEKFPLMREYEHRNLVLNCATTCMTDKIGDLRAAGIAGEHFIFSTESGREISDCIEAARAGRLPDGIKLRRMGRRDAEKPRNPGGIASPQKAGGAPVTAQRTGRRTENIAKPGKVKNKPKHGLKRRK